MRFAAVALVVFAAACGSRHSDAVVVFAAASMTDIIEELADDSPGLGIRPSFASSSELARQIRDGAPADVFVSASRAWAESLAQDGLLGGDLRVIASNVVVCIAPAGTERPFPNVAALLASLGPNDSIGLADEGVPVGEYTRQSLRTTGSLDAVLARAVGLKDVRAVLRAVERGECAAGFVYATDARVAKVRVLFALDPSTHDPIEILAAVVRASARPDAARQVLDALDGPLGRGILTRRGFAVPTRHRALDAVGR